MLVVYFLIVDVILANVNRIYGPNAALLIDVKLCLSFM